MQNNFYTNTVADTQKYGIVGATIIGRIKFWINYNNENNKNLIDGYTWTGYLSAQDISDQTGIPRQTILKHLKKLLGDGIIIRGNHNKFKYDRTSWYRLPEENEVTPIESTPSITLTPIESPSTHIESTLTPIESTIPENPDNLERDITRERNNLEVPVYSRQESLDQYENFSSVGDDYPSEEEARSDSENYTSPPEKVFSHLNLFMEVSDVSENINNNLKKVDMYKEPETDLEAIERFFKEINFPNWQEEMLNYPTAIKFQLANDLIKRGFPLKAIQFFNLYFLKYKNSTQKKNELYNLLK